MKDMLNVACTIFSDGFYTWIKLINLLYVLLETKKSESNDGERLLRQNTQLCDYYHTTIVHTTVNKGNRKTNNKWHCLYNTTKKWILLW